MRAVVSSISLLLAVLHVAGSISTEQMQAQAIIPTPNIADTHSITQDHTLLAQAVVPPHLRALDQDQVTAAVPLIEQTWENDFEKYFQTNFSEQSMTVQTIADTLGRIATKTVKKN